ncbi:class I SAM-dependent methyltransferase [Gorillibacterium massiliense]|uniref:class I SAM-dependent methyltransferase n=1 Tax=Gorillibacterium massiliense TaxID=1280390 RepID=UPI000593BE09|nr:class I SAM-dependent methyltransferase [Gorillibacterium massiliense]
MNYIIKTQKIVLTQFNCEGMVLDLGGGGEGVIGQLLKERVVAIDPREEELREAGDGPLKIIMDARDLKFIEKTFETVTSFFTLMYINRDDHIKVFQEVHRVLKNGGEFIIWDVTIPKYQGGDKDLFLVQLDIDIMGKQIKPTYGVSWEGKEQSIFYYTSIGEMVGFTTYISEKQGEVFKLIFLKK